MAEEVIHLAFIYCSGRTQSFGAGYDDFALVKFAPNGTRLWNTTWGGTGQDQCYSVAISTDGSIYCLGSTMSFGAGSYDFALVKFGIKISEPGGIPGFELFYLLLSLLALIYIVQRRSVNHTNP